MTKAAILTIGDEILLGQIVDTNSTFIAQNLSLNGIEVALKCTVGDQEADILAMLQFAFHHCQLVVITGGLGPTKDDLTKPILAQWFKTRLVEHPQALADLKELLKKRGRPINSITLKQAEHPEKAQYIRNDIGTAPGIWFEEEGKFCIAMPGVPYEMKHMLLGRVIPKLKEKLELGSILHRFVRTIGVPESNLALAIEAWENQLPAHIRLAYLPSGGQVKLRLTGRGDDEKKLEAELDSQVEKLLPLISEYVYATEDVELETLVAGLLADKGLSLEFEDEVTKGLFRNKILQHPEINIIQEKYRKGPGIVKITIRILDKENTGFDYSLEAGLSIADSGGQQQDFLKKKEMKAFLHPETNLNMVCLIAFDLLRRCILEAGPFFRPQSTKI